MKEYIVGLEKEFSLIENGFKEEEKRAFADYKFNDNEKSKKLAFLALEFSKQVQRLVMVDFPRALPTQSLTWPQIELIIYCLNLFITNR